MDWSKAVSSSALSVYQSEVSNLVSLLLNGCWESIHHLNDEVEMVVNNIKIIATETLPNVKPRKKRKNATYFKDSTLKSLCAHSKSTWHEWCDAGRPQSGPLFERKKELRREIRKRIKICSAVNERKRVKREALFQSKDNRWFRAPHSNRPRCSKLRVNGGVLSDKADLVQAWGDHFSTLAKSRRQSHEEHSTLQSKVDDLTTASLSNEEYILDVAFTLEEVQGAVNKLKLGKSAGVRMVLLLST